MTKKLTKPLAGYPRVSRKGDRDDDKFRSPDFQRDVLTRYAHANGIKLRMFDAEIDVSGSKPQRKILDEIIRLIEAGELGGIVVAKLDRLSRLKPMDRIMLFERIESAGGVVLSASEQLDASTPEGRFAREVFLSVARMQWEQKREGFETAKQHAIESGIPVHSRPPVGYRARDDRRLEPDPRSASIVRDVFEQRAQGAGPRELAALLQRHRVKTSQGSKTWTRAAIYNLLANRVYLGELSYGRDRRFVNPAAHEPLVDLATWQAAQKPGTQKLADPRSKRANLLAGIARCRACGYCLQATTTSRGKRIYRCTRAHAGGVCPEPVRVDASTLESAALDAFWKLVDDLEAKGDPDDDGHELLALEAVLAKSEKRYQQFLSPAVQDEIGDTPEYVVALGERRRARDSAAEAVGIARAKSANATKTPSARTLRKDWKTYDARSQHEALGEWFDLISVGRDRIVVFQRGTYPGDLPTRGFRRDPQLSPLVDAPAEAGVIAA